MLNKIAEEDFWCDLDTMFKSRESRVMGELGLEGARYMLVGDVFSGRGWCHCVQGALCQVGDRHVQGCSPVLIQGSMKDERFPGAPLARAKCSISESHGKAFWWKSSFSMSPGTSSICPFPTASERDGLMDRGNR